MIEVSNKDALDVTMEEGLFTPASERTEDIEADAVASGLVTFDNVTIGEGVTVACGLAETSGVRRIAATAKAPTICRMESMVIVCGGKCYGK